MLKVKVDVVMFPPVIVTFGNSGGSDSVVCCTTLLNGPRPTMVWAATLMSYITPGVRFIRLNEVTGVVVLVCMTPEEFWNWTVYCVMTPFCWFTGGGPHSTRICLAMRAEVATPVGAASGTVQQSEKRI